MPFRLHWIEGLAGTWAVSHVVSIAVFFLTLALLARVLTQRRTPTSAMSWLLAIALIPYVGVPLYFLLGGRKLRGRVARRSSRGNDEAPSATQAHTPVEELLHAADVPAATTGNTCALLDSGPDALEDIILAVDAARTSVRLTTFILARDHTGHALLGALGRAAARGVEVRVLIDGLFQWRSSPRAIARLRAAGGRVHFFAPVFPLPVRARTNLRYHRKLVVVDGTVAFVGGMNFANEYMAPASPAAQTARWQDLMLTIHGPAVAQLDDLFRADWLSSTGEGLQHGLSPAPVGAARGDQGLRSDSGRGQGRSQPPVRRHAAATQRRDRGEDQAASSIRARGGRSADTESPASEGAPVGRIQVVPSGADVVGDPLYDALLTAIFLARRRIWIATPYFIPDEALLRGLVLASHRGVDVTVIVPRRSNHLSADLAGGSFLRELEDAGGRVRPWPQGMMHAKALILDDVGVVGSANFDLRSLLLSYEVALFFTSADGVEPLEAWFRRMLLSCAPRLARAGRVRRAWEALGRLLAPIV